MKTFPDGDFILRVNMSPAEFLMADIVEFVEENLVVNGVPGSRVCIEITEYAVLDKDKPEKISSILSQFQALGLEIALDDFGTGTATLTELKNLPVDILKLDLTFVQGITHNKVDRAIVEFIIRMGDTLDKKVVAEGVETTEIADKLVELGCRRGQGYLISRPVPPQQLPRRRHHRRGRVHVRARQLAHAGGGVDLRRRGRGSRPRANGGDGERWGGRGTKEGEGEG